MSRDTGHPSFAIAGRPVGPGHPLFVIAEIGLNHGGSPDRALALVDAVADAGASAVKLQTLFADDLVAAGCPAPAHVASASLRDFFRAFELDEAAHRAIARRTRERGLAFMATPFSLDAVALLARVGVDALKIASGDLTWDALVACAARVGVPLVASTGMATLDEAAHALAVARQAGGHRAAVLHCVSSYPVPRGSENLGAIATLRDALAVPVGLSDHGDDDFAVPLAVALGASVYERHVVLAHGDGSIDDAVSSTPRELARIVEVAARTRAALGDGIKRCQPVEAVNVIPSRRGLYAARRLDPGHVIVDTDLVALRPSHAMGAGRLGEVVGRRLARPLAAGAPLDETVLEAEPPARRPRVVA